MTLRKIIFKFLDNQQECNISGWQLFNIIHNATGKSPYPTTILQICREYADITGADFICVNHSKSIYKYIPGIKIGNAILN